MKKGSERKDWCIFGVLAAVVVVAVVAFVAWRLHTAGCVW